MPFQGFSLINYRDCSSSHSRAASSRLIGCPTLVPMAILDSLFRLCLTVISHLWSTCWWTILLVRVARLQICEALWRAEVAELPEQWC